MPGHPRPTVLVVMGAAGAGKSTVGPRLATRLGYVFKDGDELHPPGNIAKMTRGEALTDEDRAPWLDAIAMLIDEWRQSGRGGVVTCSALKRRYRDVIVGPRRDVRLVYLKGARQLLRDRLAARAGHFMTVNLLDSQLDALEEPQQDEAPIVVGIASSPVRQVEEIVGALAASRSKREESL